MIGLNVVGAGCALVLAVGLGLVVHEWSHAVVLRLARIDYTISYLPNRSNGPLGLLASCPWAVVEPTPTGRDPAWVLRVAALAPAALAVPVLALGAAGGLTAETPILAATAIGWLACSIPSPQDFSVAFYAHRLLEDGAETEPKTTASVSRAD